VVGLRYFSGRTTETGQWVCLITESETLPIKALFKGPRLRLPITISPVLSSRYGRVPSLRATPGTRHGFPCS
jgi:hypothetical protein